MTARQTIRSAHGLLAVALLRSWNKRWSATSEATSLAVFWGDAPGRDIGARAKAARLKGRLYRRARVACGQARRARSGGSDLARDFGNWRVVWGRINRFQRLDARIAPHFDDAKPSIAVPFTSAQWGSLASYGARSYEIEALLRHQRQQLRRGRRIRSQVARVGGDGWRAKRPSQVAPVPDQAAVMRPANCGRSTSSRDLKGHVSRRYAPGL